MRYAIRYVDPGQTGVQLAEADAASEAALRAQWGAPPRVVLSVRPVAAEPAPRRGSNNFDVGWWCRELRTLLKAGMTVVECIETLHAQSDGGRRAQVHAALLRGLQQGQSLSRAMRDAGAFPAVLVAGITASERTSTLVSALDDYLRYDELLQRLRKQAASAAIYPAIVMVLGALITLFLLIYVIPRFSRMYADFRGEISTTTQVLLWVSRLLAEQALWLVAGAAALALAAAWVWRQGMLGALVTDLVERIAPLRAQWDHFRLAKMYQSLALMFRGGYTLDEALGVCEGLGLGLRTTAGLVRARQELSRGRAVSQAFSAAGLTEIVSLRLLAVGERTGGFDAVLQTIADRHAQAFMTFVERATRIVEPVLLLVVALVVGGIVVMMYMPIFDIANGVR